MNDMVTSLNSYVKMSREYLSSGDYPTARNYLLRACECALMLAKQNTGKVQQNYINTFKTLKSMLEDIDAKIAAASSNKDPKPEPRAPEAPTPPTTSYEPSKETPASSTPGYGDKPKPAGKTQSGQFAGDLGPRWLSDYIGQPQAVLAVKDLISAALLRGTAMPHIILYGSHGLGKSTFGKIIANEMHSNFVEANALSCTVESLIAILKQLKPNDILFIDEIHGMSTQVAESVMYSAMQDGRITYTEGKGKFAKTVTIDVVPFTLIGATTEIGKIAKPFTHRAIQVRLEEYTEEVLSRIITSSFYKLGMKISEDVALKIAKRCRNNTRTANNIVRRIFDKSLVRYAAMNNIKEHGKLSDPEQIRKCGIVVEETVVNDFFDESGIDENGLESGDRELLRIIITRYGGGPVGIDTLARALNESNNVITGKYEAYLIKKGMLKIEREGRVVMAQGYRALNMPVPEKVKEMEKESSKPEPEQPAGKYERRKVVASHVPDKLKCEKIEDLIVYPDNVITIDTPLDTLFPDVVKPYDEITKHACELEIDFGDHKRLLLCDSFLESRFATVLSKVGYLSDMKAQSLEIPYISQQLADRRYFPDFIIRDYKGRIAIIEMKNFDAACYHLNIDKYEQLAEYCRERGYGYAEVMKAYNADEYVSIESLARRPVNKQLEEFIINRIEENSKTGDAVFATKDWNEYNAKFGTVEKTEIYTVLLNNRRLRNIDRNGNDIRITLN